MNKLFSFQNHENNNFKINYNDEQLNFINSPIESSKLLGIPGGGKTQSIIGKIIHHYLRRDINQNNQFLILTFSRRACNDFIEKGKKQNRILFTTRNINTLHSLSGKIIYKIFERKSSSQDTVIVSSIDLIDNHPESILEMDEFCNLKVIFVDEAQDISDIQYKFILKISKLTNCAVVLIGDPNQNIYQFQNGSDKYLLNHPGPKYTLIKNYRSTPHIVNFINNFRPWNSLTEKMVSTKEDTDIFNKKPVIFTGKIDEIIKDIVNKILNSPFPKEQIAIIGPVKKSKPYNDSYTNIGLSLFTNLLNEYNIKYIKHYEDINKEENVDYNDLKKKEDHINLFTIHGSKGLEFHQVFLINFHFATFGIQPTEEKYRELKYLWYVGLSRSSFDLNIYIDKNKNPWNDLKDCPSDLYINENNSKPLFKELKFQQDIIPIYNTITEILNTKKIMDDQTLFDLEKSFSYEIETIPIFKEINKKIRDYKEYSALFGIFIENIFNYYYNIKFNLVADYIVKLKIMINNTIIIPKKFISGYKILKVRCPNITKNLMKLIHFSEIKNNFRKSEEDLYSFLCETLNHNYNTEFFLDCENDVINYSKTELLESIDFLENNLHSSLKKDIINKIFRITIYYYQLSNETRYLWKTDFTEHMNDLEEYIDEVIHFSISITEKFEFHKTFRHPKLPIIGELDMINSNKIIDIKFTNTLNIKHILQIILYYHIVNPIFDKEFTLELWNLQLGNKYIIHLDKKNINIFKLLKLLSKTINKKLEDMIFFYHLETTGNAYANKKEDIIDRHFEELNTSIIISSGLLKPMNVPFIPFEVTKKTGITKEDVFERGDNYHKFKSEIVEILECCKMPIFITHNSVYHDTRLFPYDKCKMIDSKIIIRLFLNEYTSNKSLIDIFVFLFKEKPEYRRSIDKVKMLISIFKKLNITEEKILMKGRLD